MERILAKTRFNNTEFTILQQNENIKFTCSNKDLSKEEIFILSYIYNNIRVDCEKMQLMGNIKLVNNYYSIFFDTRNQMYSLLLKKDGKYYEPSMEETKLFNNYFNDQPNIVFEDDEQVEDKEEKENDEEIKKLENSELTKYIKRKRLTKDFIRRFVRMGATTISFLVASGVCFASLPKLMQYELKNSVDGMIAQDFTKTDKDYEYVDVVEAIDENPNITQYEKIFLKDALYKEFKENKDYINIPVLLKRLKTLKTEYKKRMIWNEEKQAYESTEKDIEPISSAYYSSTNNKIVCFDYKRPANNKIREDWYDERIYTFENAKMTDFFHELNHLQTVSSLEADFDTISRDIGFDYSTYLSENFDIENIEEYNEEKGVIGNYHKFKIDEKELKRLKDIQTLKNNSTYFYNVLYYETINELFTREYYEEFMDNHPKRINNSNGYADEIPYMYALAELVPDSILREYKYNNNVSILIKGLLEIDNETDKAYELITSINCINYYERKKEIMLYGTIPGKTDDGKDIYYGLSDEEEAQIAEIDEEIKENYKKIHDNFAYFYNKKYHRNMSNDMIMVSYLYLTPCVTEEEKLNLIKFLNIQKGTLKNFKAKGYISEYYKEKHPCVTYDIVNGENTINVEIGEHNRYQPTKDEREER